MKKTYSSSWVGSTQPRKQRKFRANAPLHVRHSLVSAHLSKDLRASLKKRSLPLRKGDEVVILRGESRKMRGIVDRVNLRTLKVYVDSIKVKKVDGSEVLRALEPSNLLITKLILTDKMRLKEKSAVQKTTPKAAKQEKPKEIKTSAAAKEVKK